MKILLTGSNGMVGKNILDHIDAKNYQILKPSRQELDLLSIEDIDLYLKKIDQILLFMLQVWLGVSKLILNIQLDSYQIMHI